MVAFHQMPRVSLMKARRPGPTVRRRVVEHTASGAHPHEDRLATEEPLEIRIAAPGQDARRVWVTMRTPGHDFELAAGLMIHEALTTPSELRQVAYCTDADLSPEQEFNVVTVTVDGSIDLPHRHDLLGSGSSACGVCGKDSIEAVLTGSRGPRWTGPLPGPDVVRALPEVLRAAQPSFARTGGVHGAALVDEHGTLLVGREDIGRHNAVDKVTGARVLGGQVPAAAALVVSGRAGFELVQKAVAAGHGALVAVGAPSHLAVELAHDAGLALYGFTSSDRTVRYA